MAGDLNHVLRELKLHGLLLESDPKLPGVVALIAGEPVAGSWWGHPKAHEIFRITRELASHKDVLITKLVSGKVTFVHRRLWPAVVAVASAREAWQMDRLSAEARALLADVDRDGEVRTSGAAARELERALLVDGEQIHTGAGSHGKVLRSWKRFGEPGLSAAEGRKQLDDVLALMNAQFGGNGRLPWAR